LIEDGTKVVTPQNCSFAAQLPSPRRALLKSLLVLSLTLAMSPWLLGPSASSAIAPDPNTIRITADKQNYNIEKKRYTLSGRVTVAYQDIRITGPRAEMEMDANGKPEVAHFFERPMFRRVKPNVGEDSIIGDKLKLFINEERYGAIGNVESHMATVAADPFTIRSDVQEFDNKNKVVSASGNVQVDYQGSQAWSQLANVRMKDDGKAERVIFSGGAKIKKQTSEILGDKITVMVDSGNLIAENHVNTRVNLEGKNDGPDRVFITSDYQQYDKSSDMMIASGNVKIVYGDYVAIGPKATFKLKGNDLDRILLSGRGTITENGRTITADKITITTNPKNFDAVGNVKVNFKTSQKPGTTTGKPAPAAAAGKAVTPAKGGKALPQDDPSDY
jgi:lipopolysaccharide export system protein LptA